jgi:hypothetical protein
MHASSAHPLASCLLAAGLLVACSDGEATSADDPTQTSSAGLDGPSGALDGSVRCSFFYRQSNELMEGQTLEAPALQPQERVLSVAADQDASETLGRLTFSVGVHSSEQDADTVRVNAADGERSLFSILYQLSSGLPQNQFVGGHGFTGLLYFTHPTAGGDYQAFCESVR